MAGIVAAETDNGTGIAGIGYAGVKVMPVTVLDADGTGQDSDIIAGVVYAADHGADVILMSFSNPGYSAALQAAIDYAWDKGAVLVAATGNDGSSHRRPSRPATGRRRRLATPTRPTRSPARRNYGADTFLAAPGVDILTDAVGRRHHLGHRHLGLCRRGRRRRRCARRADDPAPRNGVIVGRLARSAARTSAPRSRPATAAWTWPAPRPTRSSVKPAGAAPVGTVARSSARTSQRSRRSTSTTTFMVRSATIICLAGCR